MPNFATYQPHPAQVAIHRAKDRRFRVICTGRRFGKTYCLAGELLNWARKNGGEYGWVAPTYNVADRGIEAFREVGGNVMRVFGRAPSRVELPGMAGYPPSRIWFLSADNADSIRGFGFKGLVIDEAASIPKDVWNYVLRPTISQTLGWAVFVSTPKGRNWFYDMFTRGLDPNEQDYASFTFPSKASPFFPEKEWDDARRTLPEDVFRQEYMAEFLEDNAGVFRGVDHCLCDPAFDVSVPAHVVIGCDVAKHTDWTVLVAMDAVSGRCFAMDRFNQLDWPIQKERIVSFARRYGGRVIMDATGIGDPIYDDLKRVLPCVTPFKLSQGSKTELIQRLIVAVEQVQVGWPASWEVLTSEMKRYEYNIGPSGGLSYNAPSGFHDDCVIALALANHGRWEASTCGNMLVVAGGKKRRLRGAPRCVEY